MSDSLFARGLRPPYYAVIFASQRTPGDHGYGGTADRMFELAQRQPGYLGVESVRGANGFGITISYWRDLNAIRVWKQSAEHQEAQENGRRTWYAHYELRVAKVERAYDGPGDSLHPSEQDLMKAEATP